MRVALVGAGTMGSAIGGRLLEQGCTLAFHDPAPGAGEALAVAGGERSASPAEAAERAEFVIVSLNSADIVEQAVFGPAGVAEAASEEALLIDMSSIDPARTAAMAGRLLDGTGMGWVDAPLSGGAPAAREGRLTLMLGGSEADVARAEPLLALLSARRTHMGPAGAGQTVKLVNQILCACNFMALAEAVHFAEANGLDASVIPEALAGGRADSAIMREFMAKMARRDYSPTGRIDNMLKDLETVRPGDFGLPVTNFITELHRQFVASGLGSADSAEYMRQFDNE